MLIIRIFEKGKKKKSCLTARFFNFSFNVFNYKENSRLK